MNNQDVNFDMIEQYLQNNMNSEERKSFEQKLLESSELRNEKRIHELANELIIENRMLSVTNIFHEQYEQNNKFNLRRRTVVYTLLGIIVAICISLITFNNAEQKSKETNPNREKVNTLKNGTVDNSSDQKDSVQSRFNQGSRTADIRKNPKKYLTVPSIEMGEKIIQKRESTFSNSKSIQVDLSDSIIELASPCSGTLILGHAASRKACVGVSDGSVSIYGMQGGEAPYTFKVYNSEEILQDPSHLFAGTYKVIITDSKYCNLVLNNIIVPEKECAVDYVFNPFVGEIWEISTGELIGKLTVYDESGNIYFEKQIVKGVKESWDGMSNHGETNIGYFIFVINDEEGIHKQGSITIVK